MSKISKANRMGKGNVEDLRESRLNQARTLLDLKEAPGTPKPAPLLSKPKSKEVKVLLIPPGKPAGISDKAWKIITDRAVGSRTMLDLPEGSLVEGTKYSESSRRKKQ